MIADAKHVRTVGNLPEVLGDDVISPYLRLASQRLQRLVDAADYAAAVTDAAANLDGDNNVNFTACEEETKTLGDAEAMLAIAEGLNAWNTVMQRSSGGAAGITAEGVIGENTYRYLRPDEVNKKAQDYRDKVEMLLQGFVDGTGGSPGPEISYARDPEGVEIDEDYPN